MPLGTYLEKACDQAGPRRAHLYTYRQWKREVSSLLGTVSYHLTFKWKYKTPVSTTIHVTTLREARLS